ncbi:Imm49 family immunity protein [Leeia aquatica]|uniref:Immunity protein 49 n=1 Tax=Leeia aquatica TaxID=2725557 RepID=A0A847S9T6_9NEIS|nr:Imm49 family immunity protein [Leeia aquatica]NLR74326.1 hypothetical protein [Leeia aquatica]
MTKPIDMKKYHEKASARIAHVKSHLEGFHDPVEGIKRAIQFLTEGTGSRSGCLLRLSSYLSAEAVCSWFVEQDIHALRQWSFVCASVEKAYLPLSKNLGSPGAQVLGLLFPLLSNHPGVIEWFTAYDRLFNLDRVENHKTENFRAYNAIVALRKEWSRLKTRCERVLSDPPGANSERRFQVDNQFFLALADGNMEGMQSALQELVSPAVIRGRSNLESGFTDGLISSYAVIYAKIAHLAGYPVTIDSPYLPLAWLDGTPLPHYEQPYSFLEEG